MADEAQPPEPPYPPEEERPLQSLPKEHRRLKGNSFELLEVWTKYEDLAKHFNELILKLRFQALAGVAGLSATIGLFANRVAGDSQIPPSAAAVAFGVLAALWVALAVLDLVYYNPLLLGAVDAILEVEKESRKATRIGRLRFSEAVRDHVERPFARKWWKTLAGPIFFYSIVFTLLVWLAYVTAHYTPPTGRSEHSEQRDPCRPKDPCVDRLPTDVTGVKPPTIESTDATEVLKQWEKLKDAGGWTSDLSEVASFVDAGARLLAPLLEGAGMAPAQALQVGRAFFEHFAKSAGDEAGKRTVDAVFRALSWLATRSQTPAAPSSRDVPTLSIRTMTVRFDVDRAILPPSGQSAIQAILARVPRRNGFWLLIGSTDRSGPEARNTRLAQQRTAAVAEYLAAYDVEGWLVVQKWIPELGSPVPGYDSTLDPENRRTDVIVLIVHAH